MAKKNNSNDDAKEILLTLISEHFTHLRHMETQRFSVSNLIILIAAATLTYTTHDKVDCADLFPAFLLSVLGLFGAVFCTKYYERATRHYVRIKFYRNKLDELFFDSQLLNALSNESNTAHSRTFAKSYKRISRYCRKRPALKSYKVIKIFKIIYRLKIHRLWVFLHTIILFIGLFLIGLIFYKNKMQCFA